MTKSLATATAVVALALTAGPLAAQDRAERAEQAFAELVEGRTAGEPQRCISTFNSSRLRVEAYVGLVYERGDTIWVARARDPENLTVWDVPVIDRYGTQLCSNDVMRTIDRNSGMFSGVLSLEDFVPYTKDDSGEG
ncbi:hypothetical protein OZN62_08210 [Aurantiacibacter sp. MUD11]|uniref:hypothetical protein n=1 Tax=Aurantiacibacter sp. MUD11 TaxID=3003265 RepID=UPI0022AB2285|nr:hypothetical protein [Aurantiacibacter sp. MUD11]WAT16923.1 hypothetical protein OZN62_08210 [Aurantiacibacter sp. MUD11]